MTDRELMQMAFDVLDVYREHDAKGEGFADQVYEMLRNRLAQPEWVGLTDEEIFKHDWWDEETAFHVNKYLKEKNCGTP